MILKLSGERAVFSGTGTTRYIDSTRTCEDREKQEADRKRIETKGIADAGGVIRPFDIVGSVKREVASFAAYMEAHSVAQGAIFPFMPLDW